MKRKLAPEVPDLLKQAAVLEDDLRNAHQRLENLSEQIITVNGKRYRMTFSRTLSEDELRRITAMILAGSDKTPADVRQVLENALAMLEMQDEARLAVLSVREDACEKWVAEVWVPVDGQWRLVDRMEPDTEDACRARIEHNRSPYVDPDTKYRWSRRGWRKISITSPS